ncbi:MAG: EscU/YscU/HrcU family type III secretion system export apparatus switch protein [Planctomycetota bacterium]|nr:EscU/YscU/HrcU family type III secretion system export apparatus switch protein [Planctomycetota bacterium]
MPDAFYRDELGERTEQPMPAKLIEARRQGLVARSVDLTAVLTAAAAFGALCLIAPALLKELTKMTATLLEGGSRSGWAGVGSDLAMSLSSVLWLAGALAGSVVVAALLANVLQVGLQVTAEPIRPRLSRLYPWTGFKRMLSLRTLVRMVLVAAKLAAAAIVTFMVIRRDLPRIAAVAGLQAPQIAATAGEMIIKLIFRLGLALGVLAAADMLYQRWQHRQDLKMTRREVAEHLRQMRGAPQFRSERRRMAEAGLRQEAESQAGRLEKT